MSSISEQIMEYAQTLPEGSLLRPRDFMRLGSGPAVYGAFSRLLRQDRLMRIYRGLYVLTIETRFGKVGPGIEKVIKALSELWGETIVYPAGSSANFLGLTTQVPMCRSYFTSRTYQTASLQGAGSIFTSRPKLAAGRRGPSRRRSHPRACFSSSGRGRGSDKQGRAQGFLGRGCCRASLSAPRPAEMDGGSYKCFFKREPVKFHSRSRPRLHTS